MEPDVTWIFAIVIFFYIFTRLWSDFRLNWKRKKLFRYELNEILNNDEYKVKGKNE